MKLRNLQLSHLLEEESISKPPPPPPPYSFAVCPPSS